MNSKFRDDEVLRYLGSHTYNEAMEHFNISRMTVSRIKKRNKVQIMPQKINLAIIGVGNAASALIQGIEFYKARNNNIGLLHPTLAGYHISDIEVVSAFDISAKKVGKPLNEAIAANEFVLQVAMPTSEVKVQMGEILDGVIDETRKIINPSEEKPVNIVQELKESLAEIVLCLLPSGATKAVEYYADIALSAGCAFINATPTTIAGNKEFARKYHDAGLPLIGDDLQDQFGATIVHKMILQQMLQQGVHIKESYALDVGGGAESLNTIHRSRKLKRDIKSKTVASSLKIDAPIVAGTSDYVPHMGNARNSMLWIVGHGFLGSEIVMDVKIQTQDGPNGGAILADIIRATKIALHQGSSGSIKEISCYGFKNPPKGTLNPKDAAKLLADFVLGMKS
ncbi:inositol-3-phosphate synthase [Candidatus Lokiarchaeum ossiferum]|uniref:inositol-3-phosphate synthase n=1 Tax=Candidatus Lokiarchaeum ossiferum TaxID=2951803 RepID=UPI00352E7EB1